MKIICIEDYCHTLDLTKGKEYEVFDETDDCYFVKNDLNEKTWYGKDSFQKFIKIVRCVNDSGTGFLILNKLYYVVSDCGEYYSVLNETNFKGCDYFKSRFVEVQEGVIKKSKKNNAFQHFKGIG